MARTGTLEIARISVRGVVQGVGFRPFVYQLATKYGLTGWVCNTSEDVKIEVEGDRDTLEQFLWELQAQAPPLSRIESITTTYHPPIGYKKFQIRHSIAQGGKYQLVSPDIATCQVCLKELLDTNDRRYRYPFTNCTSCGPRFTIIKDIPYDRPKTTMHSFQMCHECQREYDDPKNRRFHAQPNACPVCGPQLFLTDSSGNPVTCSDTITTASHLLKSGKIIAVKGLGGFLLACDATNETAVNLLRQRKRRPFKPFAIMVKDIEEVQKHCFVSEKEKELLLSPKAPIVLMPWKQESSVCREVAPNLKYLGVMLPYTPLHHLLLTELKLPLVMTSGNISEEPIAKDNEEALRRLSQLADYFLIHNRDVYARYDDSVVFVERNAPQLIRRARGYAPYHIRLPFKAKQILACGAELKNTFCLTRDEYAFVSQHIGDMENMETLEHFTNTIELYQKLFRIKPQIIAHDSHPEYLSTKYAWELAAKDPKIKLVPVQHHHAHVVSCMVDNNLSPPAIGVAFDGTGFGSDGHIWGGEFLVVDYTHFERLGHLEYLPLPGGTVAIQKPYRTVISYIATLLGERILTSNLTFLKDINRLEMELILRQIKTKLNSPLTSSMGRLFDAVSALIGIRGRIDYEGQAAIELEMAVHDDRDSNNIESYPYSIAGRNGVNIVLLRELFSAIIEDLTHSVSPSNISTKFHNTIARIVTEMCQLIARKTGINQVVLSGGVFQNRLLLRKIATFLETAGFKVFTHRQVPSNDGGISLGQVVIAHFAS